MVASEHLNISRCESEFFQALNGEGARYLIVGGRAVRFYCPERSTVDLDLFVGFDGENLAAVMEAMGRVDPRYFRKKLGPEAARPNIQAPVDLAGVHCDVLTSLPGVSDFEEAWRARLTVTVHGQEIPIISRVHLIENKRADADRDPKAAADLELLTR